jgi:hypothetical protein
LVRIWRAGRALYTVSQIWRLDDGEVRAAEITMKAQLFDGHVAKLTMKPSLCTDESCSQTITHNNNADVCAIFCAILCGGCKR